MTSNGTPPDLPPGLLQEYLAGMHATLGVLAGMAQRLSVAGNDREALEALGRETHKIHGSAGSYGFPQASRLAAGVEATAKDWVARPNDSEVDRASLVDWFVRRLAGMLGIQLASAAPPAATTPRPPLPRVGPPPRPPKPPPGHPPQPALRTSPHGPFPRAPAPAPSTRPGAKPPASPTPSTEGRPPAAPPRSTPRIETPLSRPVVPSVPKPEPLPPSPAGKREPEAPSGPVRAAASPPVVPKGAPPPPVPGPALPPATPGAQFAPRGAAPPHERQPAPGSGPVATVAADATVAVPEVILVEDDPSLAELLAYGLEARGYRFRTYRNGRDALRELLALEVGGTHPLLLLDVDLPGLDGYSIFDAIERARPGTYRVVFTTVHGTEEDQLRGLEAGALDYLTKPISLRVALEKIRRWVGR